MRQEGETGKRGRKRKQEADADTNAIGGRASNCRRV